MANIDDYKDQALGGQGGVVTIDSINAKYGKAPAVDGTTEGYKKSVDNWQAYLDELDGMTDKGDYTKWKLYRDYANSGLNKAKESYAAAVAKDTNALNSKMEQANIKEQSLKYAQASLDAQGLGSQGVGASVQAGIGNQYAGNNAAIDVQKSAEKNDILSSYQTYANDMRGQVKDQEFQQNQATKNDAFSLASELINSGVPMEKVKELYGDQLDAKQLGTLEALYDTTVDKFEINKPMTNQSELNAMTYFTGSDGQGRVQAFGDHFAYESNMLIHYATSGQVKENGVVMVQNGEGDTVYLKWTNRGYVRSDVNEYNKAPAKYSITNRNSSNKTNKWTVVKE